MYGHSQPMAGAGAPLGILGPMKSQAPCQHCATAAPTCPEPTQLVWSVFESGGMPWTYDLKVDVSCYLS